MVADMRCAPIGASLAGLQDLHAARPGAEHKFLLKRHTWPNLSGGFPRSCHQAYQVRCLESLLRKSHL